MTDGPTVFDLALAALLVGVALAALNARQLFAGVVLFITFGLLLGIAYARLRAPDIAMAEMAIGAGLTGVLFLNAIGALRPSGVGDRPRQERR